MTTPTFFVAPTGKKRFFFITENKKPLQNRRGNFRISSLGNEFSFRGNWHQHIVSGCDITGCRASQGPFPPPLLIRVRYSFFLIKDSTKKSKSQFYLRVEIQYVNSRSLTPLPLS